MEHNPKMEVTMTMKKECAMRTRSLQLRIIATLVCLLLLGTAVIGCDAKMTRAETLASPAKVDPNVNGGAISQSFRKALWEFAFKTSWAALSGGDNKNALYSPISLYYALAMLEAGAGGQTKDDLRAFLELTEGMDSGAELQKLYPLLLDEGTSDELIANAVWMRPELGDQVGQGWLDQMANFFYASVFKVDFNDAATPVKMSKWVEEQTRGKIKPVIDPSGADIILMNTLYFKTAWEVEFEKDRNREDSFFAPSGKLDDVTFMNETFSDHNYLAADQFRASAIKLKNGKIDFILPNEGVSPETLLAKPDFLKSVYEGERRTAEVVFSIPKFSYRTKIDVLKNMESLGLRRILQGRPDLTVMVAPHLPTEVSWITQETFIELNEKGVEAAAYTEIAVPTSMPPPDSVVELWFNRPFIYVISDDAGVPLFVGVVNNPLASW